MRKISYKDDTEAVLIIDASIVFNVVNKTTFLHNVQVVGPEISVYVRNCYLQPTRHLVVGGTEIRSSEGTIEGDPIAMAVYATSIILLIMMILKATDRLPIKRIWRRLFS